MLSYRHILACWKLLCYEWETKQGGYKRSEGKVPFQGHLFLHNSPASQQICASLEDVRELPVRLLLWISTPSWKFDVRILDWDKLPDGPHQWYPFYCLKVHFGLAAGLFGVLCLFVLPLFIGCGRGARRGRRPGTTQPWITPIQCLLPKQGGGIDGGHYQVAVSSI